MKIFLDKSKTPMVTYITLYIVQFLFMPAVYDNVFGGTNEGSVVFFLSTIISTGFGMFLFPDKLRTWLSGLKFYAILMCLYTPPGAYGIGIVGMFNAASYDPWMRWIGITIAFVCVFLIQSSMWVFVKAFKSFQKNMKGKS